MTKHYTKKQKAITPLTLAQAFYLTIKFFLQNRLLSYAGACSFSFIFSFVPVFMMIVAILMRFLHTTPDTLTRLFDTVPGIERFMSIQHVINSVQNLNLNSTFEVVLVLTIIWMARRFFASIMDTIQCVFHTEHQRKSIITQIVIIFLEALVTVTVSVTIFAYLSFKAIHFIPLPDVISDRLEFISLILSKQYIIQLPNIILFIAVYIAYRVGPGTKPSSRSCIIFAAVCTGGFWVSRLFIHTFLNTGNYNLIYGFLGQMMMTMLDMFFFFTIFMFLLQALFVKQFFAELLLGELYLLPKKEKAGIKDHMKRILFIRPHALMAQKANMFTIDKGTLIHSPGEKSSDAYYIVKGEVGITRGAQHAVLSKGDFFGELDCILNSERTSLATAQKDCVILRINGQTFRTLVQQNPDCARKAMGQISTYFSKVYGLTGVF